MEYFEQRSRGFYFFFLFSSSLLILVTSNPGAHSGLRLMKCFILISHGELMALQNAGVFFPYDFAAFFSLRILHALYYHIPRGCLVIAKFA